MFPSTYSELWQVYEGWLYGAGAVLTCGKHELAYELARIYPRRNRVHALTVAVTMLEKEAKRERWVLYVNGLEYANQNYAS